VADRATTSTEGAPALPSHARLGYLDDLKVAAVAAVVVFHGLVGYATFGSWPYQSVREGTLPAAAAALVAVVAAPAALFLMGLLFLVAGLLTPRSVDRKGPGRFAVDRLVRLGIPLVVFTLVLWPLLLVARDRAVGRHTSYVDAVAHGEPFLDNGPLWFVLVLLVFSLGYAAWRALRPGPSRARVVTGRTLVGVAVATGVATYVVRLWFRVDSPQVANIHLWQWPQCLAMFLLGVAAARSGWLEAVPDRLRRRAGVVAVVAAAVVPLVLVGAAASGRELDTDAFGGGPGLPAVVLACIEGALAVSAGTYLLATAQRHRLRETPLRLGARRAAYGAYVLQGPVLLGLALALRGLGVPVLLKAVVVAGLGVVLSFALAALLVRRTPARAVL
jgi:hypothetical protein